jgi:hypothetical protein
MQEKVPAAAGEKQTSDGISRGQKSGKVDFRVHIAGQALRGIVDKL